MDNLPINALDLIIIAVLIISGAFAFLRGLVREVLSVGAWVGAAIVTLYAFPHVSPHVGQWIKISLVAELVSGVAIFIVTLIVLTLASRFLAQQVQRSGLGPIDRSLGFVFGLLRGAVLFSLLWLVVGLVSPPGDLPTWVQEARARPLLEKGKDILLALAPPRLREQSTEPPGGSLGQGTLSLDNLDAIRQLSTPTLRSNEEGGTAGYEEAERKDLQRLFESADGNEEGSSQ